MILHTQIFQQAQDNWKLEQLYQDLTTAKQEYCGKRKKLTPVEMSCLRGLLCGYSPPEIATELNREPRGLRVDLSRGLYRYVEVLAQRESNELNDWRDVASWLSRYKMSSSSACDSSIKIVDISLGGTRQTPILDIKVRNIGKQVAFLKKVRFKFYKIWVLQSWLPTATLKKKRSQSTAPSPAYSDTAVAPEMSRSRAVEPSYDYEIDFSEMSRDWTRRGNLAVPHRDRVQSFSTSDPCIEEVNISQCVSCNDVDRFTLSLNFPQDSPSTDSQEYQTHIHHLQLEIIYDEDDKVAESQSLILWIEPDKNPLLKKRCFIASDFQEQSEQNQKALAEISKITGIRSFFLDRLLS
ncbi:hypothetical protein IQ249_11185 [Lusitaniella coriacea LEGE 07157]|uniref:Uncharacterized protein n=1 Tax=Lusitaniella coriacea LEGE 07157 TaxID=945747 RepID=A0A8J7DXY5_9CYAN|nr:hypothetical protein [Lusitaniella coriacea]MBE9116463.1 hypothetical protein [Lusitaniella coriacea LEGE 07157]